MEETFIWKKATRSAGQGNCVEVGWRKSSRSNGQANCVEVGSASGVVAVRDTKDRAAGYFTADDRQWRSFLAGIRAGRFDPEHSEY